MSKGFYFFILSSFTIFNTGFSQSQDSIKMAEQYYNLGIATYDFTHRKQAKENFLLALNYNPNHAKAQFMAGKSIMLTVHKEEALPHFLKAIELDNKVDEEVFYYIGMAYHHSNQYDKAIEYYQLHRKKLIRTLDFERAKKINEVERKIFECRNAKIYEANPVDVTITLMGDEINSEYPDYAPVVSVDESTLVFTSRREDNINLDIADDHEYFEDIFISYKKNGEWGPAQNIGTSINTRFHNSCISMSADGNELLLYMSVNGGDIYQSNKKPDGTWGEPFPLPGEINSEYLENSASLSEDLKTLYFTSDRPGGYGGTDIYVSRLDESGLWGKPTLLGPDINTEMDEDGVFLSENGKHLYFSSNGHAGMGGLDIYRGELDPSSGKFVNPVNLGYPINTVENDIYFTLSGDEKHAYFSSVKSNTKGEQDIYFIDLSNFKPVTLEEVVAIQDAEDPIVGIPDSILVKMDISVIDKSTGKSLKGNELSISNTNPDLKLRDLGNGKYHIEFYHNGQKPINYRIEVENDNYTTANFPIYIAGIKDPVFQIDEVIKLEPRMEIKTPSNILNIPFEFDSDVPISMDGASYLSLMMQYNPDLKVVIRGYTDNSGDSIYNKDLSLRRAKAVGRYLQANGIAKSRITTVGYGENDPGFSNESRLGRKLNRRIEFDIFEEAQDAPTEQTLNESVKK